MLDAALVDKCADPSLTGAVVKQFIEAAGSEDPLAVTVKSDGRLVLIPKPKTLDEAMQVVRNYVGHAVVRIGLTQYPAGIGMTEVSELKPDIIDSCQNLHLGTAMFAKVIRIVAHWYGNPTDKKVFPHIFDDAIYAWKTGNFEGTSIFLAPDPGGPVLRNRDALPVKDVVPPSAGATLTLSEEGNSESADVSRAAMRIDLSRIQGGK